MLLSFFFLASSYATAAIIPPLPAMVLGFTNPKILYSTGKHAICVNGVVSVAAAAVNANLLLAEPTSQLNATEIFQELFQAGSTVVQRTNGGTRTVSSTYGIGGTLCYPASIAAAKSVKTIEILTHGVGLEKSYWDIAPGYSYVDAAAMAGYATFAYDRLGVGQSDHPDPIQDVQAALEVEILHGLAQIFRAGKVGVQKFANVVGVGHSFGSILQVGVNSKYPKDFDAAVLTAFINSLANLPFTILANDPSIAALNQPERFGNLPYGYLVHNDAIAIQEPFFRYPFFDPKIFQSQVAVKDTYTFGEEFTIAGVLNPAPQFTGPIDVVTGKNDFTFCLGDCTFPTDQLAKVKPELYPAASAGSDEYVVPDCGHYINAHFAAPKAFVQINAFLKNNGL